MVEKSAILNLRKWEVIFKNLQWNANKEDRRKFVLCKSSQLKPHSKHRYKKKRFTNWLTFDAWFCEVRPAFHEKNLSPVRIDIISNLNSFVPIIHDSKSSVLVSCQNNFEKYYDNRLMKRSSTFEGSCSPKSKFPILVRRCSKYKPSKFIDSNFDLFMDFIMKVRHSKWALIAS